MLLFVSVAQIKINYTNFKYNISMAVSGKWWYLCNPFPLALSLYHKSNLTL